MTYNIVIMARISESVQESHDSSPNAFPLSHSSIVICIGVKGQVIVVNYYLRPSIYNKLENVANIGTVH